ncbi:isoprenylcysteine carboxyl methyltransferase family protein [Shouchella miscanthi]|uniref:Isoprenylcysteine carboxyl methyltransferase family protein n=1 Tax=Shouchella miscanthi TaxID=2598861 RepID=A0ABU6NFD6_9BACI|nr:isoprenylcysteine carboxyl methyltransferase family protein [Shouchella miscanthi]
MLIWVYGMISVIIAQRLIEVVVAKRNERWMKSNGGIEVGKTHYHWMVALHVSFFIALLLEVTFTTPSFTSISVVALLIVIIAQCIRIWALTSLGRYWNTKIIVLPDAPVVEKGPYRFLRHPNYAVVMTEIAFVPLIFQAYWTAILFTVLNAWMLSVRIRVEEKALYKMTGDYTERFERKKRFWFV